MRTAVTTGHATRVHGIVELRHRHDAEARPDRAPPGSNRPTRPRTHRTHAQWTHLRNLRRRGVRAGRVEDAPDLRRGVSSRTKKTSEKHPILRHHRRDRRVGIEPTTHRTHQTARRRSSRRGVRPHAHAPGHRAPGDATRVARRGEHTTRRHGSMVLRRKYKNRRRSRRRSAG